MIWEKTFLSNQIVITILTRKATKEEIKKASEEFGDYIKIVLDLEKERAAIGGRLHTDIEKVLLESGSVQKDLWGGGLDLANKTFDTQAMINIRPFENNDNMEILDPQTRKKFLEICNKLISNL